MKEDTLPPTPAISVLHTVSPRIPVGRLQQATAQCLEQGQVCVPVCLCVHVCRCGSSSKSPVSVPVQHWDSKPRHDWFSELRSLCSHSRLFYPPSPHAHWPPRPMFLFSSSNADEAQEAEAIRILTSILSIRESTSSKEPPKIILVLKTLSLLYYLMMDNSKVSFPRKAPVQMETAKHLTVQSSSVLPTISRASFHSITFPVRLWISSHRGTFSRAA